MRWSRRSGCALTILIVSTRVNRRDFRTESCRWTSMQTVAPFYPKCAISRSMKSQARSVLQYNAKQDLILISKKQNWYSCNLDVFCDKGIAILQSLPFFWPLNSQFGLFFFFALFGFLLKFSSGVKRNFWPVIVSQLFHFLEQRNKVWQLLFRCVSCKLKYFG